MRPPAVGIETNPRSHLAPDSLFVFLVFVFFSTSLSRLLDGHGAVGVGEGWRRDLPLFFALIMRPMEGGGGGGRKRRLDRWMDVWLPDSLGPEQKIHYVAIVT